MPNKYVNQAENDDKDNMSIVDKITNILNDKLRGTILLTKNQPRFDEVQSAILEISEFVSEINPNIKIEVTTDELVGTSLIMRITGCLLVIDEMDKFCNAISKANNFEVSALTDGDIVFSAVFRNAFKLVKPPQK